MSDPVQGFYAYPSQPVGIPEVATNAAREINNSQECHIKTWQECSVNGKFLINVICREIDNAGLFIADLTDANSNVLFELGYAIARRKRIWLLLDTSIDESKTLFDQLRILTSVGYSQYTNAKHIVEQFYHEQPWLHLQETVFQMYIEPALSEHKERWLLYLKNQIETEPSRLLSRAVESSKLPYRLNDPAETAVQSLTWYASNIWQCLGLIVHLSEPRRHGSRIHNARYAFVSGLAHGLEKPLLMLAGTEYQTPIDYHDILAHYESAARCKDLAAEWLEERSREYAQAPQPTGTYAKKVALAVGLRSLNLGEYLAENEEETLFEYFVETQPFLRATTEQSCVVVGRKGSGKTANLYMAAKRLGEDKRNLVCVIKPVSYDVQGVVRLGKQIEEQDKKGYLVEALWKFLIYSEIARTAYEEILLRPYIEPGSPEDALRRTMEEQGSTLQDSFAVRLERCVSDLLCNATDSSLSEFRGGVSELLHDSVLQELRKCLGALLTKRQRVAVLIDNLDKAWDRRADLNYLSDFLFGLLRAAKDIPKDFARRDHWRAPVNVSITVFLRSDIFARLTKDAREPDKLQHDRLSWDDPETLMRVLDERLSVSRGGIDPDEVWRDMFCATVRGVASREHILQSILPRPRDLVFFAKAALSTAVNRGHTRVEEDDIIQAGKEYSQFVFEGIQVENGISLPELEAIMIEFVGGNRTLSREDVLAVVGKSGLESERREYAVQHLIGLSFLGVETTRDEFRYCTNPDEMQKLIRLSERYSEESGAQPRYRIHNAFLAFLEAS